MNRPGARCRAFTITETLVVIGVIGLMIGILFPALLKVGRVARKSDSMSRLRQINLWMNTYSSDSNDTILPSQFDYSNPALNPYPGKVRTIPTNAVGLTLSEGAENQGTWADILWTINDLGLAQQNLLTAEVDLGHSFRYDSPTNELYNYLDNDLTNPLRSAAFNTRYVSGGDGIPKPYGDGANAPNLPGYFAANDFFNARPDAPGATFTGNWYTIGQIRVPERVMYLVDSYAGEIIEPVPDSYDNPWYSTAEGPQAYSKDDPGEVDFRYAGSSLMLFMDGHIGDEGPWTDLAELQDQRQVIVTDPLSSTP